MVRDVVLAVMSSLAKIEREKIAERTKAGLQRARVKGTRSGRAIGRPRISRKVEDAIAAELATGKGILKVARKLKVGSSVVQRVRQEMSPT
jgi:DNA invertase Pin-like site-specific DNA recombinase